MKVKSSGLRKAKSSRVRDRVKGALNVGAFCMCTELTRHDHENALFMGVMILGKISFVLLVGMPRFIRSVEAKEVWRLMASIAFAQKDVIARVERSAEIVRCVMARNGPLVCAAAKSTVDEYVSLLEAFPQRRRLVKKMAEGANVPQDINEIMTLVATCSEATMGYVTVLAERAATLLGREEMQGMFEALRVMRAALERVRASQF